MNHKKKKKKTVMHRKWKNGIIKAEVNDTGISFAV